MSSPDKKMATLTTRDNKTTGAVALGIIFNYPVIWLVRFYQICLSPILPRSCRFEPTCSEYALIAFKRFSFFIALYLSAKRLLKCHPFCEGGFDPVPKTGDPCCHEGNE